MAAGPRTPGAVTVVVTVLRDPRVARALESLRQQRRAPACVLVDDGGGPGSPVRAIAEAAARDWPAVRWLDAPGTIAESRNRALREVTTEFVAFLDADEIAPPGWLEELVAPLEADPGLAFTGGPTPALPGSIRGAGVAYYDAYLRRFYDTVAADHPASLPMGNSAWRMEVFDRLGPLDTTLYPRASSEDQEFAVRALSAGWRGRYVPSAWVEHDFSDLTSGGILAKQSRYALGGFVVWRRHGSTYEATGGRLAPYLAPPALLLVGAVVAPFGPALGLVLLLLGAAGLGALALALTVQGLRWESRYPGMRFRAFEILRRWATLVGAARGWVRYGWSGRRGTGRSGSGAPVSGKP
ncbi:MAG: glycosyltransferase [Thermoplasmata archaeon]